MLIPLLRLLSPLLPVLATEKRRAEVLRRARVGCSLSPLFGRDCGASFCPFKTWLHSLEIISVISEERVTKSPIADAAERLGKNLPHSLTPSLSDHQNEVMRDGSVGMRHYCVGLCGIVCHVNCVGSSAIGSARPSSVTG